MIHEVGRSSGSVARVVGSLSTTNLKSPMSAAGAEDAGAAVAAPLAGAVAGAALGVAVVPPQAVTTIASVPSSAKPRRLKRSCEGLLLFPGGRP